MRSLAPRFLPRLFGVVLALCLGQARSAGGQEPTVAAGTEVFTGRDEARQAREKPAAPATAYWRVQAFMRLPEARAGTHAQMLLPISDARQQILTRRVHADGFNFRETPQGDNLWGQWTVLQPSTRPLEFGYEITLKASDADHAVPHTAFNAWTAPPDAQADLAPSRLIQSGDPEIRRRAHEIVKDAQTIDAVLWALFQYTSAFVKGGNNEPHADAVTVLREERGSSTGKARLLTAMLRAVGIPARVVGGLKLEDASKKRATTSWVEARLGPAGDRWLPLDPGGGYFGWLPNQYLALYRGDLPLIVHSAEAQLEYEFVVHQATREMAGGPVSDGFARQTAAPTAEELAGGERVRTTASYVDRPVASVVVIVDQSVAAAVSERILQEAQADEVNVVLLQARFESRYFRELYLQRLVQNNLELIRKAHLLLIATGDDAGLYALLTLGEKAVQLPDARVVIAGNFLRPVGAIIGQVLQKLVDAGEIVLVNRPADLLALWEMARANLINGTPMTEEARKWDLKPLVLGYDAQQQIGWWRRLIVEGWVRAVRAQVPLQALNLILILPIIAAIIVVARTLIGLETFGTFSPVIVSLAFLTTGLRWGAAIFAVIVGLGALVRVLLQHLRLQLVSRLAILIAIVAGIMAGLTVIGASFGIGALMNVSIFPMVIMSNVIENFTTSQAEFGTREAIRLTINTLLLAATCYLAVESTGLQSIVLVFPEVLIGAIVIDVVLGKWRGLRLLEYARFFDLTRRVEKPWRPG
ncbi:MAG TPA: 7TM domain-containing protein [Candidatus Kryptonia bacterium]|nr:7TM domain-containing protein [Candidatus Kryptonia bacterium]